jgi:ABC-2 type transport system permease protein
VNSGRVRAQAGMEIRLLLRNGESLLVTLGIPVGLLVFFSTVDVLPAGRDEPVTFLLPGIVALAVMGSAMVALGIATGFERFYLVLKRLGATPLRRSELITAKVAAVLAVQAVQVAVVMAAGVALGWRLAAGPTVWLVPAGLALGTAAFAGLGLAMAGRLRAVATLALTNAAFVVLLLVSGIVFPLSALPTGLRAAAGLLPGAPLTEVLRAGFDGGGVPAGALAVLAGWAAGAVALAAWVFRWE